MSTNLEVIIGGRSKITLIGYDQQAGTIENLLVDKMDLAIRSKEDHWQVHLTDVDLSAAVVMDTTIDRDDGGFFSLHFTSKLGYLAPTIFETLKNGLAGTVCLLVRKDSEGKRYVVVETKNVINYNYEVEERQRACRSSVSSLSGSPIPKGSRKPFVHDVGIIELNDMRIAGPVQGYVVEQHWMEPLAPGQRLIPFADFVNSKDAPGKAVLFAYMAKVLKW